MTKKAVLDTQDDEVANLATPEAPLPPTTPLVAVPARPSFAPALMNNRMDQVEFIRTEWAVTPEAGTPIEKVLEPEYWVHVCKKLAIGAKIEVVPDDAAYYAEVFVLDVGPSFAKVALLRHVELEAVSPRDELAGLTITWGGRLAKFQVWRGETLLSEKHAQQATARQWAQEYVKRTT